MEDKLFIQVSEVLGMDFALMVQAEGRLIDSIEDAKNYYQQLQALKKYYLSREKNFRDTFHKSKFAWASSYPIDWGLLLTPIELEAWMSIRRKGRIVLYPQYPALNYHLDFANPGLGICVELDGKQYHDKERDARRDSDLKAAGWTVFRITGSEMMRVNYQELFQIEDPYDYASPDDQERDLQYWLLNTGDGVIEAIREVYFLDNHWQDSESELHRRYNAFCHQTLEKHKS